MSDHIQNLKDLRVQVDGKTRIVRAKNIRHQTKGQLECKYKGHLVWIEKQKEGDFYVAVTDEAGRYAVQGGFGGQYCRYGIETIEDCLAMCIKNILL